MKRILIIIIVVAVIAGGVYGFLRYRVIQQRDEVLSGLQSVSVELGSLTATVGATGTVRVNQTAILTWQTSGVIDDVHVNVGDFVEDDTILANLEQTSLSQAIIMAEADLVNARQALQDLRDSFSDLSLALAQQAVANARKAVENAQRNVANLTYRADQDDIDAAEANVVLAENSLEQAQNAYEPYADKPEDNIIRATLLTRLTEARRAYEAAVRNLNYLIGTADPVDLEVAQTALTVAQEQLLETEQELADFEDGPDPDDIAVLETRIAAAQATLNLSRIEAPFAGTVTEVHSKPGDLVVPGAPGFRLDDLSRLLVDVQVSEVDINRVEVGQPVHLTFDAILGSEYQGEVVEVALVGNTVQGVVNFTVTVELIDVDGSVKPGMTAAVNIVVSERENVLLVPNRAVRTRDGQRVVYIMNSDGSIDYIEISLGSSSETMSEVMDGALAVGDLVILNPPLDFSQFGGPPFGGH